MARDINLGPTGGPFVNIQENSGDLDITGASDVDLNGANLTNASGVDADTVKGNDIDSDGDGIVDKADEVVNVVEGFDEIAVFSSDGTFDASNVDVGFVEVVGGGGGGGGETNAGLLAGAGGGGGGYAAATVDLSNTTNVSVTVGAGGSGGTAGTNDGSAGGNSSFGTLVEASGGSGGASNGGPATTAGGSALTGDVLIDGEDGSGDYAAGSQNMAKQPEGGGNVYSNGSGGTFVGLNNSLDGLDGDCPGGGGAGGLENDSGTEVAGGDGADGIVIVRY